MEIQWEEHRFRCATAMPKGQSGSPRPVVVFLALSFLPSLGKGLGKPPVSCVPTSHLARIRFMVFSSVAVTGQVTISDSLPLGTGQVAFLWL